MKEWIKISKKLVTSSISKKEYNSNIMQGTISTKRTEQVKLNGKYLTLKTRLLISSENPNKIFRSIM